VFCVCVLLFSMASAEDVSAVRASVDAAAADLARLKESPLYEQWARRFEPDAEPMNENLGEFGAALKTA
jgi:hypothetical protein